MNSNQETYSNLIYPYDKPTDYYNSKPTKQTIGRVINYDPSLYEHIESTYKLSPQNFLRFKIASLKSKAPVYFNCVLEIGMIYNICFHNNKTMMKMILYFGNKSNLQVNNMRVQYVGNESLLFLLKNN